MRRRANGELHKPLHTLSRSEQGEGGLVGWGATCHILASKSLSIDVGLVAEGHSGYIGDVEVGYMDVPNLDHHRWQ